MRVQPLVQPLHVGGPAVCIADRVQEQLVLGDADGPEQFRIELDHLRVDERIGASDHLERQLVVLAVAAPAGPAVAIHRREGVELDRLRLLEKTVLHVGACDRGGALRTKRERAIAPVGKGVHLLVHDVGGLARRALEEASVLESRRLDAAVAVDGCQLLDRGDELPPAAV